MDTVKNRYPGAQPFSDNEFSRSVFFGREDASRTLADKILANRIVVVYGRSGLGKTSLLNAGVAPLLREEGYLPLFMRVNDTEKGAFHSVLEVIPSEAARQQVEYTPGQTDSLWSFFKTAEFWRGDLLLTPVLILDQFEELFTLQNEQARAHFLDELSYLVRGVQPPSAVSSTHGELSERPPPIRVLLSLREDYLGFLEEAAEQIPQIFNSRFRLSPLDFATAEKAIIGPARVDDPELGTRPFTIDREAVSDILNFLSRRRTSTGTDSRRYVEPFQLQLVCRRIELIAAARQHDSSSDITITMADIGGEAALTETLGDFYGDSVLSLPDRRARRASRRLCEEYLISTEGRRLSLEENEISRQLNLTKEMLAQLVTSRLLRTENRSDSTYYELSHDALVEPILASQQKKATVTGWCGIVSGTALFFTFALISLFLMAGIFVYEYDPDATTRVGEVIGLLLLLSAALMLIFLSASMLRNSARSLLRHRRASAAMQTAPDQALPQRGGLVSGLLILTAGAIIVLLGLLILICGLILVGVSFIENILPVVEALDIGELAQQVVAKGVGLDLIAFIIGSVAALLVGGRLMRRGVYSMVRYPDHRRHSVETPDKQSSNTARNRTAARIFIGSIFLTGAILLAVSTLLEADCTYLSSGLFYNRVPPDWFSFLELWCTEEYDTVIEDLIGNVLLITCCLFVAVPMLSRGLTPMLNQLPKSKHA
jgi:hypothetical protein